MLFPVTREAVHSRHYLGRQDLDVEQVCDTHDRLKTGSIWHSKIVYMPCSVEFLRRLPRIATKSVDTYFGMALREP